MGKDKKGSKIIYDEDGNEYQVEDVEAESDSDSSSESSESDDGGRREKKEKKSDKKSKGKRSRSEKGSEKVSEKKSKNTSKKRSLEEEASLQGDDSKKTEAEQLQQFLEVNKKKISQAESFLKKARKAQKKLKTIKSSDWEKANGFLTEAAKRKSLLIALENNNNMNDNNQLRKGSPKIRQHGEELFKQAMEIAGTLSPEEAEKLWSDECQGRNKNAKCFDDLITKKEALTRSEVDALRKSLINAGIDPSIQSQVLGEIANHHKTPSERAKEKLLAQQSSNLATTSSESVETIPNIQKDLNNNPEHQHDTQNMLLESIPIETQITSN
jgi:hypothetical protein